MGKPLQFHEVSKILQTRLQESKKNVHGVKIIEKANKSPTLQIQVEKGVLQRDEQGIENQANEKKVSNDTTEVVITQNSNDNSYTTKKNKETQGKDFPKNIPLQITTPRSGRNKVQLSKQVGNRKSIENELNKSFSKSREKEPNNVTGTCKIKVVENNQN